jgi:hypothetical protein
LLYGAAYADNAVENGKTHHTEKIIGNGHHEKPKERVKRHSRPKSAFQRPSLGIEPSREQSDIGEEQQIEERNSRLRGQRGDDELRMGASQPKDFTAQYGLVFRRDNDDHGINRPRRPEAHFVLIGWNVGISQETQANIG